MITGYNAANPNSSKFTIRKHDLSSSWLWVEILSSRGQAIRTVLNKEQAKYIAEKLLAWANEKKEVKARIFGEI